MIKLNVKFISEIETVLKKAKAASLKNLGFFGGLTRKKARQSIKISPTYADAGKPPHSRKGLLKQAIIYAVDKDAQEVIIGPSANVISDAGHPHEFGGDFRGNKYAARPFMLPALKQTTAAFDKIWANSIKP